MPVTLERTQASYRVWKRRQVLIVLHEHSARLLGKNCLKSLFRIKCQVHTENGWYARISPRLNEYSSCLARQSSAKRPARSPTSDFRWFAMASGLTSVPYTSNAIAVCIYILNTAEVLFQEICASPERLLAVTVLAVSPTDQST